VWDLEHQRKLRSVGQPDWPAHVLAVTPDGRRALTGNAWGRLRLWDLERGEELCPCPDNVAGTNCVALSPDGRLALSGHHEGATLFDIMSGKIDKTFREKGIAIQPVAFSPSGRHFAHSSSHGNLHLRRTDTTKLLWWNESPAHGDFRCLVFSGDGSRLYSARCNYGIARPSLEEGAIRVWDTVTGKLLDKLPGHTGAVSCLALSPDGTQLLSGAGDFKNRDCTVRLWDLKKRKELKRFVDHKTPVTSVAFAPDGKHAVSVSHTQAILWDLDADPRKAGRDLKTGGKVVAFVGQRQYVCAWSNHLFVCDLEGKIINQWTLPHAVNGLAPSKDGKYLATANSNGTVYILRLPLQGSPR
jgi:WD40 repeat protein